MASLRVDIGIEIPMRDGTVLAADVVRPAAAGRYPAVLTRTPYDRRTYASTGLQTHTLRLAEAGYAVCVQDVRGRGGSGGSFLPFVHERDDGIDTIQWLTEQRWCSGQVGTAGISYLAFCQITSAVNGPEPLRAWIPGLTPADVRTSWIREGGAFAMGFHLSWLLGVIAANDPRTARREEVLAAFENPIRTARDPASIAVTPFESVWRRWMLPSDPYPDDARVPTTSDLAEVRAPALVVGGWFDLFQPGTFELWEGIQRNSLLPHALLAGPWDHSGLPLKRRAGDGDFGGSAVVDLHQEQLRFFDLHLRESGDTPPVARVFITGDNVWDSFSAWPPEGRSSVWYPWSNGRLEPAAAEIGEISALMDPLDPTPAVGGRLFPWEPALRPGQYEQSLREARSDVLTFSSEPLREEMAIAGPARFRMMGGADGPQADVFVTLCDVDPLGRSLNIGEGIRRLDLPQAPISFEVSLGHLAHNFRRGHRLRLDVSFAAFPRFDLVIRRPTRHTLVCGPGTRLELSRLD